jgi:hypothetical protein
MAAQLGPGRIVQRGVRPKAVGAAERGQVRPIEGPDVEAGRLHRCQLGVVGAGVADQPK